MSEFSWIIIIRITWWYAPPCTMYPEDCDFKEKSPWCQLIYPLETNTVMQADTVTGNLIWCKVGGHILELMNKKASVSAAHHLPGSSTDGGGSKRMKETKERRKLSPSHTHKRLTRPILGCTSLVSPFLSARWTLHLYSYILSLPQYYVSTAPHLY